MGVRREKVIVDLEDRASRPLAFMAASADTYAKRLDAANKGSRDFDRSNTDLAKSIDYMAVRVSTLSHLVTTFGTALIPMATAAVPAVAGLANQMGFAAIAGGTAIVAFQGVGDALKALNEAQLDPSAEKLQKLQEELDKLGPAGQEFVYSLQALRPQLQGLQDAAQAGLFPGLTDAIDSMMTRFPQVQHIVGVVADAMGDLASQGAAAIAGPGWDDWFNMIEREARPALEDMGRAIGGFTKGLAELWMAFMPLSKDFSGGLADMGESFASWAEGLSQTEGFAAFVDYVRTTVPDVLDTLGALGMALVDLGTAFAPVGDVALKALTALAEALSAIASSDVGPTLAMLFAGMRAYSLAATIAARSSQAFATSQGGMFGGFEKQRASLSQLKTELFGVGAAQREVAKAQAVASRAAGIYAGQLQINNRLQAQGIAPTVAQQGRLADSLGRVEMANYAVAQATERANGAKATQRARLGELAGSAGKAGAVMGGLALATSGAADSMGGANTATLALMGTMAGPFGAAAGAAVGLVMDLGAASKNLGDAISQAKLAMETGDINAMTAAQGQLATATDKASTSFKDLTPTDFTGIGVFTGSIGKFSSVIANMTGKTDEGAQAQKDLARSMTEAKLQAQEVEAYKRQAAALRASSAAAQETAKSFLDISKFADDADVSLDGFIRKMQQQAAALAAFGQNANKALSRGIPQGLVEQLRALGPAGAMRLEQLANATDAQIARVVRAFNRGADATRSYQRSLGILPDEVITMIKTPGADTSRERLVSLIRQYKLTPKQVSTLITETGGVPTRALIQSLIREARSYDRQKSSATLSAQDRATNTIRGVIGWLASVPRTITTTLITRRAPVGNGGVATIGQAVADGGTIQGQRRPYGDKVLTYLAPGEEVISNRYGQADRNRALLKQINDNRMADGGTVRSRAVNRRSTVGLAAGSQVVSMRGAQLLVDGGELGTIVMTVLDDRMSGEAQMAGYLERAGYGY